ncbi:MAG: Gfo/Idh/MocA family oxidoreductase [Armatimonadota bacterium]|nr:MAG: Gfo/Idh/MocA family oxidoreductase [Armatimonadota bacterium]
MPAKTNKTTAKFETKTKGQIGVAIIGASIGRAHLSGYRKSPDARIIGVCDLDAARAQAAAAEFGAERVFTDYRELLKLDELDAVSVCLPNYLHASVTIDCLRAGKHVMCEKPLAMNAREGERMVAAAREAKRLLMIALNNRFRGDTGVLKQFIAKGELGRIYFGKTGWLRRSGCPRGWFGVKKMSGGGPLIDLGVHMLDLAWYLMGKPKPVRASGLTYSEIGPSDKGGYGVGHGAGKFDVEDLAVALVRFENDAAIQLEVSWASHIERDRTFLDIYGTVGGASLEPQLRIFTDKQGVHIDMAPAAPNVSGHEMEAIHFVECIRGRAEPIAPGEDGLTVQRMLDAIYRSGNTGKEVAIGR